VRRLPGIRIIALIIAPAVIAGAGLFAQESTVGDSLLSPLSPRSAGIGGRHTTLADGIDTLTANPAGFRSAPTAFLGGELAVRLSGPVLTLSSIILSGVDEGFDSVFAQPETLETLQRLYTSLGLVGPISVGFVGDGLGFAISNTTDISLRTQGSTRVSAVAQEVLLLSGGFALPVPLPERAGDLDLGILLKGFVQGASSIETSLLSIPDLFDSFDSNLVLGAPFDVATGLSVDVGARYAVLPWLSIGLTGQNLLAPALVNSYGSLTGFLDNEEAIDERQTSVPINVSAGVGFTPQLGRLERHISDFRVLLDYRDGLDFWTDPANTENPFLKIAAGVEATFLDVIILRLGLSEGLPAAGLGMDLGAVELDAAAFGDELTGEPGFRSVYNIMFGLRIGG